MEGSISVDFEYDYAKSRITSYTGVHGRLNADNGHVYLTYFMSGKFLKDFYDTIKFFMSFETLYHVEGSKSLDMFIEYGGFDAGYLRPENDLHTEWKMYYEADIFRHYESINYPVPHDTKPTWEDIKAQYDPMPSIGEHQQWSDTAHCWMPYKNKF